MFGGGEFKLDTEQQREFLAKSVVTPPAPSDPFAAAAAVKPPAPTEPTR